MRHLGALRQRFSVDARAFASTNAQPPTGASCGDGGPRRPSIRPTLLQQPGTADIHEEDEENEQRNDDDDEIYFTFAPSSGGAASAARRKSETDVVDEDNQKV